MKKEEELEKYQIVERDLTTKYRKAIWLKFVEGINEFDMIKDGDKIAVCISGGKDSMLLAKCMQEIKRHRKKDFELEFIVMDPGYSEKNRQKIIDNAKLLNVPIHIFNSNIFDVVTHIDDHPCYLCARMRRGHLYKFAKSLGCNKIALGHHFDDVVETILMGMMYGAQMQTMMPKLHSTFHEGMELIRPLYYVKEADIIQWRDDNELEFLQCACKFTEDYTRTNNEEGMSKRKEMKDLLKELRKKYDKIDMNIYNSTKNVNLKTIISYVQDNKVHHFLDTYDQDIPKGKVEVKHHFKKNETKKDD